MKSHAMQPTCVTRDEGSDAVTEPRISKTAAQRQRAYRQRSKRAAIDAIGQEAEAPRVTLLAMLAFDLAGLDSPTTSEHMASAMRNGARRVLTTIVTRYGIEL